MVLKQTGNKREAEGTDWHLPAQRVKPARETNNLCMRNLKHNS